jgi:hypothetical protein
MNCLPHNFSEGASVSKADCMKLKIQEFLFSNPRYGTSGWSKTTVERGSVIYFTDIVHYIFLEGTLKPVNRAD